MKQIFDFRFWIFDGGAHPKMHNPKSKIQNPKFLRYVAWLSTLVGFCFIGSSAVLACPLCKEALFDPSQFQQKLSTAKGYALSIFLLLLVPTSVITGIACSIVRSIRHGRSTVNPQSSPTVDTTKASR